MPGIDLEDVMAGISVCRNPDLANVFYRLHLIEAYGTGISKIIGAYADEEEKPVIETTRNTFKIILPNINAMREKVRISEPEAKEENPETNKEDTQELSSEEEQVLEYAGKHEDFTKNDVVSLLKVSASTAARVIRGLVERNFLKLKWKSEKYLLYASKIIYGNHKRIHEGGKPCGFFFKRKISKKHPVEKVLHVRNAHTFWEYKI